MAEDLTKVVSDSKVAKVHAQSTEEIREASDIIALSPIFFNAYSDIKISLS